MTADTSQTSLVDRGLAPVVEDAMRSARVVAVLGPRQAGKSTLAQLVAANRQDVQSVSLDDASVRAAALADPHGFVAALGRSTVIDEIQRAPDLLLAIKWRVDRDQSRGQFLLTGSANLRQLPAVSDALPGRVDYLTLWPFTQGEIAGERESFLDLAFEGRVPQLSRAEVGMGAYTDRLLTGGFPEVQHRVGASRSRFFASYVDSIIDRDIADVARVHDPSATGRLFRLVAARSSALARYETVSRDLGLDGKTVKAHLSVLERLYLIRIRQAWHVNLGKRQVKAPKLYISDAGLMSGMLALNHRRLEADGGLSGALLETFVATELERQSSWSEAALTFWHYRDGSREVDTIVEHPSGDIIGVEVKAGATVRPSDFNGMTSVRDRVGTRMRAGIVLYTGERTLPFGDRLWAVPLAGLWAPRDSV